MAPADRNRLGSGRLRGRAPVARRVAARGQEPVPFAHARKVPAAAREGKRGPVLRRLVIHGFRRFLGALALLAGPAATASPAWAHSGARLEPPDGAILHGAQAGASSIVLWERPKWDTTSIPDYEAAAGARPLLLVQYFSIDDPAPAKQGKIRSIADTVSRGRVPVVGLAFHTAVREEGRDTGAKRDLCVEIAAGGRDHALIEFAQRLAEMKGPVFLRPGYEFGPGGDGQVYDPKAYPDAFRRVVRLLREQGAANVAVVWHQGKAPDPMHWYPGDEWVDWWGLSLFQYPRADAREFAAEASRHGKPLLIGEASPRDEGSAGPRAWKNWYAPFFDFIRSTPCVKGFCYLNNTWSGWHSWKDSRIERDPLTARLYREEMARPAYLHAGESAPAPLFWGPAVDLRAGVEVETGEKGRLIVTWKTIAVGGAPAACVGGLRLQKAGAPRAERIESVPEPAPVAEHRIVTDPLPAGTWRLRALCTTASGQEIGSPEITVKTGSSPAAAGGAR